MVDDRPGEGDAPGVELGDVVGDDEAAHLVNGLGVGEERGGVSVGAHAEGEEVEAGAFRAFEAEVLRSRTRSGRRRLPGSSPSMRCICMAGNGTW